MVDSLLAIGWFLLLVGLCYGIGRFFWEPSPPLPPLPPKGEGGAAIVGFPDERVTTSLISPSPCGGRGGRGVRAPGSLERFVFAIPLGMGVVSLLLLGLGVARLFVAPVFYALLALGVPGLVFLVRDIAAFRPTKAEPGSNKLLDLGFTALFIVLALCTLIAALAPPGGSEWDALSYHLTVPKTYLREGRIFYIPYDHHSNFPFLLQMLYSLLLGVGSIGGAKLCHWLCGVLLAFSVYTFARRQHGDVNGHRIGQIAALVIAASPIVLWEASIAYVDLATALFTWLSVYALIASHKSEASASSPLPFFLSPVLMGFAIGTKLTVLGFWGILLGGMIGADILRNRRVSGDLVKRVVLWAGISLLLAAPWLLRSYLYTGSPVYPYFYNIFGGRYWSAENAAQYSRDQANLGLGKDPLFLLLAPWLMNVNPTASKYNEYPFGFAFALVPLLLTAPFKPGKWSRTSIALALFALFGYIFWFFLVQGTRYFVPMLPLVALLGAESLMGLWNTGKGFARYVGAAVVAASGVWGMYFAANVFAVPAIRVVLGTQSRSEYVAGTQWMGTLLPACEWINANTPKDSKVALFDVVFGFYIDRPILWANPNHVAGLLPWDSYQTVDDWLNDFKRRGYTTILTDEAFAPPADSPLQSQKWRSFLLEAVASGKVTVGFEKADERGHVCRVYRIR